ncbi:MAG: hypothetical protein KF803_11505 [Cyclobacteriaceae bacterium]|nr:hypothetical protein [Cyclobacteriaceae bacterium]
MDRILIYRDIGEFGFSEFHVWNGEKWVWTDLEVDVDVSTLKIFKANNQIQFQIWLTDDRTKVGIASNFMGHIRQAFLASEMFEKIKVEFGRPAKAGGEFDLSIDSKRYKGQIISGEIKVALKGNYWDMSDYEEKKRSLQKMIESILTLTNGQLTKATEFVNA